MNYTQEQINEALTIADSREDCGCWETEKILAAAYHAEKQDADDLEKYVAELVAQVNKEKDRADKVYGWLDQANFKKNKYLARAELAERQYNEFREWFDRPFEEEARLAKLGLFEDIDRLLARHDLERKAFEAHP
jgi:hypothetical protein